MLVRQHVEDITALFDSIERSCPQVAAQVVRERATLRMRIPEQPGLAFPIEVALQGSEVELTAAVGFSVWFNVDGPSLRELHRIVVGLVTGEYRLIENRRFGSIVRVDLQTRIATEWKTIARSWTGSLALLPLPTSKTVLQNALPKREHGAS